MAARVQQLRNESAPNEALRAAHKERCRKLWKAASDVGIEVASEHVQRGSIKSEDIADAAPGAMLAITSLTILHLAKNKVAELEAEDNAAGVSPPSRGFACVGGGGAGKDDKNKDVDILLIKGEVKLTRKDVPTNNAAAAKLESLIIALRQQDLNDREHRALTATLLQEAQSPSAFKSSSKSSSGDNNQAADEQERRISNQSRANNNRATTTTTTGTSTSSSSFAAWFARRRANSTGARAAAAAAQMPRDARRRQVVSNLAGQVVGVALEAMRLDNFGAGFRRITKHLLEKFPVPESKSESASAGVEEASSDNDNNAASASASGRPTGSGTGPTTPEMRQRPVRNPRVGSGRRHSSAPNARNTTPQTPRGGAGNNGNANTNDVVNFKPKSGASSSQAKSSSGAPPSSSSGAALPAGVSPQPPASTSQAWNLPPSSSSSAALARPPKVHRGTRPKPSRNGSTSSRATAVVAQQGEDSATGGRLARSRSNSASN